MRKKSDALSKAWETINIPLVAADSAMKDRSNEEQKERKSLLLAVKRNSRERQARHIAKRMPIKAAQSKENTMSRIRGQSKTHTTGSIAREKQATHAHISKLMDDLPKDKPSKGITVTKKTVSMKPVSETKPVTLCDLKKKAGINLFHKYREKKAAAGGGAGYGLSEALKQGSDKQAKKRFMLKVAASNLSPREKLAMAGLVGRGLAAGAKSLPGLMRGAGKAVRGAGILAGKGLESAGKGVQSAGKLRPSRAKLLRAAERAGTRGAIPESMRSPFIRNISQAAQGAGKAMQAGGRAMQAAPGVAGGAGLAGLAAGRMSKRQPQQPAFGPNQYSGLTQLNKEQQAPGVGNPFTRWNDRRKQGVGENFDAVGDLAGKGWSNIRENFTGQPTGQTQSGIGWKPGEPRRGIFSTSNAPQLPPGLAEQQRQISHEGLQAGQGGPSQPVRQQSRSDF